MTGSFCTLKASLAALEELAKYPIKIKPIMSENVYNTDTRFFKAQDLINRVEEICGEKVIHDIVGAEPIGPKGFLDALVIAPCTGNTISKIANGITDSSVTMASKANLRNNRPLVIAVSSNDALGANAKNIGALLNTQNIYFVPFTQDEPHSKPDSLVADMAKISKTLSLALDGQQLQPILAVKDK